MPPLGTLARRAVCMYTYAQMGGQVENIKNSSFSFNFELKLMFWGFVFWLDIVKLSYAGWLLV